MNLNFAMIFPGQGSQSVGMLADLAQHFPQVKSVFDRASAVLEYDLWELTQTDPDHKLGHTQYTQPALLAADVAVWECWLAQGGALPSIMAGHSLGEYSALVCAEALNFEDAIRLVSARGRYMQAAVAPGEGAMAAIVGLEMHQILELCAKAATYGVVSPANYNSIGQTVVAGQTVAVQQVVEEALTIGAKLAKILPVSVPSHCALMDPAAHQLRHDLAKIELHKPKIPVLQNADISVHTDTTIIRQLLVDQLTSPVRWVETIEIFVEQNRVQLMIECGPGKVLAGLNKRITPVKTVSVNDAASLTEALALLP